MDVYFGPKILKKNLSLLKFTYNNSCQASIEMTPLRDNVDIYLVGEILWMELFLDRS